jgi:type I restriction enzyme S subunit
MFTTQPQDFVLALPPLAEQDRIAAEVERRSTLSEFCATSTMVSMRRAQSLRQAVLKWAFEGKLVDQNPNDEPAEKLLARIRADRAAAVSATKANGRRRGAA